MYADYHVHSNFSDDSSYLMEDVVKDSIRKGLDEICFTDHVDYGIKTDWLPDESAESKNIKNVNYACYFSELSRLSKKYKNKLSIKKGLEFGMQVHTIPAFKNLFESYDFDFILLSVHQVDNKEFWTGDFQRNRTEQECYDRYYDEMYQLVQSYTDYSVLAHTDLIRRYLDKNNDGFEKNQLMLEKILKVVIKDKKGIEVNTSSERYGINDLTPSKKILELYFQLGGQVITIGSDSHEPEHLAFRINETKKILKEIGFTRFCTFDKMKPIFHEL